MNRFGLSSRRAARLMLPALVVLAIALLAPPALADGGTGEASLRVPDLGQVTFGGVSSRALLMWGLVVCALGLVFGTVIFSQLKNLPVHRAMREISELIYETCKTYLVTQGKFLMLLWAFIAVVILLYFGVLLKYEALRVAVILLFSVVGIAGSYGVAWFGIRVNTFANSRTAFAGLRGKPYPIYAIPLKAGMSIGMLLVSVELLIMLFILLFVPGDLAGACFIGFAIGESLGAAALRVAGGIFTKIADIGSDLMKIAFKIKEDDARKTGVALISFILGAVRDPVVQVQLLVWIFSMRILMIIASALSYFVNSAVAKTKYENAAKMNFEAPLTSLVWLTSIVSVALTFVLSWVLIPN